MREPRLELSLIFGGVAFEEAASKGFKPELFTGAGFEPSERAALAALMLLAAVLTLLAAESVGATVEDLGASEFGAAVLSVRVPHPEHRSTPKIAAVSV